MTFSIAIPVHNGEKYLRETLESATCQTRPADEILVVDDASSDGSVDIIRNFQKDHAIRYVFNEQPTGYVDAWNRAIRFSTGDYVTLLHQDDLIDRRYLENVERAFIKFPTAHHLYSGYCYINECGEITQRSPLPHELAPKLIVGSEYAKEYLHGVAVNAHLHRCPGVTTQRSLLLDHCSYRKEAGLIADDDFFIRVGHFTDVIGIEYPLASFRIHGDSATSRLESLSYRLGHDYVFSVRFHQQYREFLDDEGRAIIARLASRFINQLLFDGGRMNNKVWINAALELSVEMNALVPNWKASFLPAWSKILWLLIFRQKHFSRAANLYCKTLGVSITVKRHLMRILSPKPNLNQHL